MNVIYWGKVYRGQRALGICFDDFPGCVGSWAHPMTLREEASKLLQLHIKGTIEDKIIIPKPTGIKMPLMEPMDFIGFLPVEVDVPETFVKEWEK